MLNLVSHANLNKSIEDIISMKLLVIMPGVYCIDPHSAQKESGTVRGKTVFTVHENMVMFPWCTSNPTLPRHPKSNSSNCLLEK